MGQISYLILKLIYTVPQIIPDFIHSKGVLEGFQSFLSSAGFVSCQ